jgi:hypothetical protein
VSKDHATARRLPRRLMPGSGPLERASDRIQILARVGVRRMLDRSRMRRWAADRAVVEPVWSRKVP